MQIVFALSYNAWKWRVSVRGSSVLSVSRGSQLISNLSLGKHGDDRSNDIVHVIFLH